MATVDDYNEMQYFEAYKAQFENLNPNVKIDTPEGLSLYLQYLNFLQGRRTAMVLTEILKTLNKQKPLDEIEKKG